MMGPLMLSKLIGSIERFATFLALMRSIIIFISDSNFLPYFEMSSSVIVHIPFGIEYVTTICTFEGLRPQVYSLMYYQVSFGRKILFAENTKKLLFIASMY